MSAGEDNELASIIAFATAERRVCPQPQSWNELWQMLPSRKRTGAGWSPLAPLILAAWSETSDAEKQERLLYHIRYAAEHNALGQVDRFLHSLRDEQWHNCGDV
jgi:hypothetical protein